MRNMNSGTEPAGKVTVPKMKKKVLVVSHGHPDINPGGGEIAAYNLHHKLNATGAYESVFFARHAEEDRAHGGTSFAGTGKPQEILFYVPMGNWFRFSQADKPKIWRDFRETLELTKPDIVHFHHYVHLGLELIREVKNFNPEIAIVMTLHEYFGICHNHGQMVKTNNNNLCFKSTAADCSNCFPQYSAQDFFLRKQFISSYFDLVDRFISPSEFLRQRYMEWGLDAERISVIENIDDSPPVIEKPTTNRDDFIRFSYFGQINWFKGVDVLIDAFNFLPSRIRKKIVIDINGSGLENQPKEMIKYVYDSIEASNGKIRLRGRYQPGELPKLMANTDWVVIPSKWWENSPMVITEAKKFGTPVICSDIGGMAEKVEDQVTGLHFQVRKPDSLAEKMTWAVENADKRNEFVSAIQGRFLPEEPLTQHCSLYEQVATDKKCLPVAKAA